MTAPYFPLDTQITINNGTITLDGALDRTGITKYEIFKNGSKVSEQIISDDTIGKEALSGLDWIVNNAIRPDGAIVDRWTWPGFNDWDNYPYYGHYIAEGLLMGKYLNEAKNWLVWYMNHTQWPDYSGVNGPVYDYNYSGSTEISRGDYDSIDSYAALFFRTLMKYHKCGGDMAWLTNYSDRGRNGRTVIDGIANAMTATLGADNLTRAKNWYGPGDSTIWPTKFLMDNTETYQGCLGATYVFGTIYNDSSKSNYFSNLATAVKTAEDGYWQKIVTGRYSWWKNQYNQYSGFANNTVWPDWGTNLAVMFWDVLDPKSSRASQLWADFKATHPNFGSLNDPEQTTASYGIAGPWAWVWVAVIAAKVGDTAYARQYLTNIKTKYPTYGGRYGAFNIAMYAWTARILRQVQFTDSSILATDIYKVVSYNTGGEAVELTFNGNAQIVSNSTPPPTIQEVPMLFNSQLDTITFDLTTSDYFPATYSRTYSPVTVTIDTVRKITQLVTTTSDSNRKLTNSNILNSDTKRKITNTNTINPDTKRIVRVSNLLQTDTQRLVSALVSTASDTLRQVMGTNAVTTTVDTIRRIVVSETVQNDTKRKVTNNNIITGDTKRSVWLSIQNAVDTVRRITNDITNSVDTLRQIVNLHITVLPVDTLRKVTNSQFVRIDTKRSVWKQVQTLADTIRKFFTGGAWPVTIKTDVTPRKVILDATQRKVLLEVDGKMRNIVVTAGNTVTLKATFYDKDGNPADSAGTIKFIIFDEGQNEIENFSINDSNKVSDGVYCLDYTTPRSGNRFLYWEASSTLGEVAELDRKKIELKWVV